MKYEHIVSGTFISRPNRFIAKVMINGKEETVHVKNTGRCKELLLPGVTVILEDFTHSQKQRKTNYDLIAVYKKLSDNKTILINMDSQAPNKVALEYLKKQNYSYIKPEYTYGSSRVDFYMERTESDNSVTKCLMEIKGCTLEKNGTGYFPDAPTERGVKHLMELASASKTGIECTIGFVIQIPEVKEVLPNIETHPQFGKALKAAEDAGVKILYLLCDITEDTLNIKDAIYKIN